MNSTDVFAGFVAAVVDSLDEPETTGCDLARQVHLSRSQFDRVVAGRRR
ncbi:hypothetical protein [Kribbella qitaiheensis]|nr:hypothetical protein [Kribbella qitaiheensis]